MCCGKSPESTLDKPNWFAVVTAATVVGILTGLLGIGGGFLIVPALVIFLKVPIKVAAGTSLVAITVNSLLAFGLRYEFWDQIPLAEIAIFTFSAIIASTLLTPLSAKINSKVLQRVFSIVIALVASYTLFTI
jgi:uncharacterized membrane protein YfcA